MPPTESLWRILKPKVEDIRPQTKEQLTEVIPATWNQLDMGVISDLIEYVPERVVAVVEKQGGRIAYRRYT
jgi:hypothetical protein